MPFTMSTTNGSVFVQGAGTDGLSLEEIDATADEDRESVGRI